MRLRARAAVVTGAARGIGLAISERFVREGARVADFEARTGLCVARIAPQLERLRARGLMVEDPTRLCTTAQGFRYLNAVLEEFA